MKPELKVLNQAFCIYRFRPETPVFTRVLSQGFYWIGKTDQGLWISSARYGFWMRRC